ncbi:phosphomannomutase [Citrobacter braakii]|nr:phosphomannomutase [Citrobacter braakii]
MIPWLLVAELLSLKGQSLGELVRDRMVAYPASGEINSTLAEPAAAIARVEQHFSREALTVDRNGRYQHGVCRLALQFTLFQYRTGGAPERGIARKYSVDGRKNKVDP